MTDIPRSITNSLSEWSIQSDRKVLLLRGPRQIGKTYSVRRFASARFEHVLEVNFLVDKRIASLFDGDLYIDDHRRAWARPDPSFVAYMHLAQVVELVDTLV